MEFLTDGVEEAVEKLPPKYELLPEGKVGVLEVCWLTS
jgi:hypothetical protein